MKTKRRRGRPKTKNVAHVAPAAAPASPEHDPPADNVTAESPLSATAALNANKVAFLNLVGQIAQENLALDKSNDAAGLHGVRSASHSSSSSSSLSSKGDDSFHVDDINGGFEEPEVDWRPTQSGRKRGRPSKGDVSSKGASNVQVIKKIMEMDEAASFSSPIEPVPVGFVSFSCFISALQE
ncbi:hypothetical protein LINPERPRIM_LOCUS26601 [Linum perenne]